MSQGIEQIQTGTVVVNAVARGITGFLNRFLTLETFLIVAFLLGLAFVLFMAWKEDVVKKSNFRKKYREI